MPSNKEYTDQILAIDPNAKTDGLKNAELGDLLKDLKNKGVVFNKPSDEQIQKVAETGAKLFETLGGTAQADQTGNDDDQTGNDDDQTGNDDAPGVEKIYRVVEGKSITSKKGILGPGDEVKSEYFPQGKDTLENLVKLGLIS